MVVPTATVIASSAALVPTNALVLIEAVASRLGDYCKARVMLAL